MKDEEICEILGWPRDWKGGREGLLSRIIKVVEAEREACAKLCESMALEYDCVDVRQAAEAIRKRG